MAHSFTCDGCGTSIETPIVVGFVLKRDYCPKCEKKAQKFLDAEDAERTKARNVFTLNRAFLVEKYGMNNFKLPDVP